MYFWKSKWSRSRIILLGWSVIVTQDGTYAGQQGVAGLGSVPTHAFAFVFQIIIPRLLTWPRMMGVAIYESTDTFPNPLLNDLDNTVSAM